MTTPRWQTVSAYLVLLLTCSAGALHSGPGPWLVLASTCVLALNSLVANRTASVPQSRIVSEPILVAANLLNSAAIASAAYIFGYVARWAWGL